MEQKVYIVDDDQGLRDSLKWLLESEGMLVESFASAIAFLERIMVDMDVLNDNINHSCLLTDVCMPGMNGLELQTQLINNNIDIPIIFISGQCTPAMAQQAMDNGAIDFIYKPFSDSILLDRINYIFKQAS